MRALALTFTVLSLVLLAAHALRWGSVGECGFWLLLALLPLLRQAWVLPVLLAALLYGAWQWLGAGVMLVQMRMAFGEPWLRLAGIMGGVMLVDLAAAGLLLHPRAAAHFRKGRGSAWPQAAAFAITAILLFVATAKAPLPLLLSQRYFPGWGELQIFFHALYAALLTGAFMQPAQHRRLRPWMWGLFSLVFFGQLALGLAGVEAMLMSGKLHLPVPALILGGPLYRGGGYFMLILFGATLLLVGPAWCSHLCYIGAWDDGCSRLSGRRPQQPQRTPWVGRAVTLGLTVAVALGLRHAGVGWPLAVGLAALFGLAGVAVMLTLSRKRGRMVHCTAYCPMGLVSNVLGKLTPWRMRMAEGCTQCGACSRVCRYGALRPADLEAGRPGLSCTLCGDCASACKHGVLEYRLWRFGPRASRAVFIALVCSLHAAFLAVARM